MKNDLDPLFNPNHIAVLGASANPEKLGGMVLANLLGGNFAGRVFAINPKAGAINPKAWGIAPKAGPINPKSGSIDWPIAGLQALAKVSDIPPECRPLDLAVICLPARQVEDALQELAALPVRAAIVLAAGFNERGGEGALLEARLKALAEEHNIILLGPNSLGLLNSAAGLNVTACPPAALWGQDGAAPGITLQPPAQPEAPEPFGPEPFGPGTFGPEPFGPEPFGPEPFGPEPFSQGQTAPASRAPLQQAGSTAFFSQSGALGLAILDWAKSRGLTFSLFAGLGNMAGVDEADLLAWLANSPHTNVILGYLESVKNGPKFLQAATYAARKKPVIVLRAGRSAAGARAASAHGGSSNSPNLVYNAACKKCGILQVERIESLFALAQGFASQPLPKGPGLGLVTNAGGPAILAADASEACGLKLAELTAETVTRLTSLLPPYASFFNPVNAVNASDAQTLTQSLRITLEDPNVHAALLVYSATPQCPPDALAEELCACMAELAPRLNKPLLCCLMGGASVENARARLRQAQIPCYSFPEDAVETLAAMHRYNQWRHIPRPVEVSYHRDLARAKKILNAAKAENIVNLGAFQAMELLKAYDIPVLEPRLARSSDEAVQIAKQLGQPVALKISSPQIQNKAALNGVTLDLQNPQKIREAFLSMTSQARRLRPEAYISGCLVQAMAPKNSREVNIAFRRDERFGALVFFSLSGFNAGYINDFSCRLAPLSAAEVYGMLREIRLFPVLAGMRWQKPVQFNALEDILLIISQMSQDFPEIQEAEFGPVMAGEHEAVVVDAKITLRRS